MRMGGSWYFAVFYAALYEAFVFGVTFWEGEGAARHGGIDVGELEGECCAAFLFVEV